MALGHAHSGSVFYSVRLIAFLLHNSSLQVLFCIIVLHLAVISMLNPGKSPTAPLVALVCWSSVSHQVEHLVIGVIFE
jgi:hypothetical protein